MDPKFTFIECEGVQIAVFIETQSMEEHPTYYSSNLLFYVIKGQLNFKVDQKLSIVKSQSFCLVRKFTHGTSFKSWTKEEKGAQIMAFALKDEFIQEALVDTNKKASQTEIEDRIVLLTSNKILKGLFDSISLYISGNEMMDRQWLRLKTQEALLGILKTNPNHISIFSNFASPEKAQLTDFMEHHYKENISLAKLARLSGRSLSTFNREFKAIFKESPHRWIVSKRLEKAKELLLTTGQKSSDIYLQLGFEDLAHFSRSFKKKFGKTPTEMSNSLS